MATVKVSQNEPAWLYPDKAEKYVWYRCETDSHLYIKMDNGTWASLSRGDGTISAPCAPFQTSRIRRFLGAITITQE